MVTADEAISLLKKCSDATADKESVIMRHDERGDFSAEDERRVIERGRAAFTAAFEAMTGRKPTAEELTKMVNW